MIQKIKAIIFSQKHQKESGISYFVHSARSAEKKRVFKRVIDKAIQDQQKVLQGVSQ